MVYLSLFLGTIQGAIGDPNKFNNYLLLGYFAMWLIAFGYTIYLANRQNNLRKEIDLLKQLLEEHEERTGE